MLKAVVSSPAFSTPARVLLGLVLGALPGFAVGTVRVTAPRNLVVAGAQVALTAVVEDAPTQGCTWRVVGTQGAITAAGVFTAPAEAEQRLYRIQATSVHDAAAMGEAAILVLGQGAATVALDQVMRQTTEPARERSLWQTSPSIGSLPFLDAETGRRYRDAAQVTVHRAAGEPCQQLVGYNLRVPLLWEEPKATHGALLTLREGGDVIRFAGRHQEAPVVQLNGRVRDCTLELLHCTDPATDRWTSHTLPHNLQVRGLVPFAGNLHASIAPDHEDGQGLGARFREPWGMAMLGDPEAGTEGCVVADHASHVVRTVASDGTVVTLGGKADVPGFQDGQGGAARFNGPTFLAAQPAHADGETFAFTRVFLVSDSGNHAIRAMDEAGHVTTLAGSGVPGLVNGDNPLEARFHNPQGLALAYDDTVYVADAGNHVLRRIDPQGRVTTFAGSGAPGSQDGVGAAASFTSLRGLTFAEPAGTLYAVDGHAIRRIDADGTVTTILGQVTVPGFAVNVATQAGQAAPCLNQPCGIAAFENKLLIADEGNHAIRLAVIMNPSEPQPSYPLLTVLGDPGQQETRFGLLRDGLPWSLTPDYGAVRAPRGLTFSGAKGAYVATGHGLAHLSALMELDSTDAFSGFHLGRPKDAAQKVGQPFSLDVRLPFLDPLGNGFGFQWTLTFVTPGTSPAVLATLTGRGHNGDGTHFAIPATLGQAGQVEARLKVVSDEGMTWHHSRALTIEP